MKTILLPSLLTFVGLLTLVIVDMGNFEKATAPVTNSNKALGVTEENTALPLPPHSPTPNTNIVNTQQPKIDAPPTTETDPIVTCQSKTGNIQVRRSICNTYTDCPDGHGNFVFVSQDSCKKMWETYGDQITSVTNQMIEAWKERDQLYQLERDLNNSILEQEIQNYSNEPVPQYKTDLLPFEPPIITYPSPSPSPNLAPVPIDGIKFHP